MKKKGFTLVELLAVIAILAILIILALPNTMSLYNEAKKDSFTTEVKNIVNNAKQQWISDSMFSTSEEIYCRGNGAFFVYCAKSDNSLNGSFYTIEYGVRPVLEVNTSDL